MKLRILKSTLVVVLCFGLFSCNKMLDLHPKDSLEDEKIYTSVGNFEAAVLGVYAGLETEYNVLIGSVLADENRISTDNMGVNGYAANLHRWTYAADEQVLYAAWKCHYESIYRVNLLLKNINRVPGDANKLAHLEGELLALRSFIHFELHRIYGSNGLTADSYTIPYVTDTDINKKPAKLSVPSFYQSIWKDINAALDKGTGQQLDARFNVGALQALAARVALYQQDYQKAIAYAGLVIDEHRLVRPNAYEDIWKDVPSSEVIMRLKRNNASAMRPNLLWRNYGAGKTLFFPSNKWMSSFEEDDVRGLLFSEDRDDDDENYTPIAKYAGNDYAAQVNDVKLFRVSEMFLIRAEAYLRSSPANQQLALQDIQAIRNARNASPINAITLSDVLQERYLELAFEGHRYFDLKRLHLNIYRNKEDLATESDQMELSPSGTAYFLPVPHKEVLVNPNIK